MTEVTESERYHPFFPEHGWNLPAMLINAGHETRRHDRPYEFSGLQRGREELAIFQYTLGGEGELDFEGARRRILPGTAMLLAVPEEHCYRLPVRSDFWEYYYVSVNGGEAMRLFREFRRRHGVLLELPPDAPAVRSVEELLCKLREGRVPDHLTASRLAYGFVISLLGSGQGGAASGGGGLLPLIDRYCLDHMDEPVKVAELAEFAGLSFWHFSRRFKEETGETPRDYILKLKMAYALRRLQDTADSIKAIAMECGFADQSHFCKVFRRLFRETPEGFRCGGRSGKRT